MLTGKQAFAGTSPASIIAAILEREAPSVSSVAPPGLDHVLRRCLVKDRENRWQSARDLKAELEWIATSESVSPRTVPRRALFPWIGGSLRAPRSPGSRHGVGAGKPCPLSRGLSDFDLTLLKAHRSNV